jgi:hypothetical protein
MKEPSLSSVLLISSGGELPDQNRVWGTGGWMPPEEREALDWLTLCRLLGWSVEVARSGEAHFANAVKQHHRCIILGCSPEALSFEEATLLLARISEGPAMLITRLGSEATPLDSGVRSGVAHGRCLAWEGPGCDARWNLRKDATLEGMAPGRDGLIWAGLDGVPIVTARPVQQGTVVTLSFNPSSARDLAGYFTALLRHLLIFGPAREVSWLDLANTLILRMDDPGGAQNVHSLPWAHRKLDRAAWRELSGDLSSRGARLSVGYVSGWVDDGDAIRGDLRVDAQQVPRLAGQIYPSALVEYRDLAGHNPGTVHDYADEFTGIRDLRRARTAEVELHGYTHMHPDRAQWTAAADRYYGTHWYREFGADAARHYDNLPLDRHPLQLGIREIECRFGTRPSTLIFPGDKWTDASMEVALDLGLNLVSSYYLALRHGDRFCWATHVCAPYLDSAQPEWFDAGLPVIGYFHDRDLAVAGTSWMREWLDQWIADGARNLIDFRQLTEYLSTSARVEPLRRIRREESAIL